MAELQEPKLPEFYSPGRVFLSAFAAGAAIAARKTQLENQLQHLQLQNEAMQYREQQQEALFGLKQQSMESLNQYRLQEIANAQDREQRISDAARIKQQSDEFDTQRRIALSNDLFSIPAQRGTKEWRQQADQIYHKYTDVLGEPEAKAVTSQLEAQHTRASAELTKAVSKAQTDYQAQVKGLGGNPRIIDYYFNNPNMWKVQGDKAFIDYDKNAQPVPPGDKTRAGSFTVPKSTYDTIMSTKSRAYPKTPSETPDVDSVPHPMAPWSAPQAPADPSARQANTVYQTPKGNLMWTGTGWTTP